ncbi:MAG TPA: sulfatase-like hydrolase/transferase, partial [Planctomycetaceae bacterium]|nr:sulfatase-like hydrolase/transferase [Planctomycetaceae bacterium]
TPNIDKLAADGVKLERFYSCPMCSPTRAGFMTGRWPLRFGMMRAVIPPWSDYGLPGSETTLPELLATAGYERRAIIGKWHLGHARHAHHPLEHGFTYFYGHYNGAIDYFTHERDGEVDWHRNRETVKEEGYSTDLLAADAAKFIAESPKDKPYFLYVPFNAPHSPFQAKPEDLAKYPDRKGKKKTLAAMIDCLDQGVGKILAAIDERGDADRTFVLFFSDNGGVDGVSDNSPLRGAKLTPYEGGIRVVACARYPNGNMIGGKMIQERMGYIDLLPTICQLAGAEIPESLTLDGIDVAAAMAGAEKLPDRAWCTYEAQKNNLERSYAAQTNDWKLVVKGPALFSTDPSQVKVEVYHLSEDPKETKHVLERAVQFAGPLMQKLNEFTLLNQEGVTPYGEGREGFKAPQDWRIE